MTSNTIVKSGTPFIDLVLRQVEPFMDKMIITVSDNSQDGTRQIVDKFKRKFSKKVLVLTESVTHPSELTTERQRQLEYVEDGEDVLFLDDDDFWPTEALEELQRLDFSNADAYCFAPYQVISEKTYDSNWNKKWFTKLFKKTPDVHYRHPWPRDLIYKGEDVLYWKKNKQVRKSPIKFFHLSYLKKYSFRNEPWAKDYGMNIGRMENFPDYEKKNIDLIYKYAR